MSDAQCWPEQDAVDRWCHKYWPTMPAEWKMDLKIAVTEPRIKVQEAHAKEVADLKVQLAMADKGLLKASDPKSGWQGKSKECKLWQERAEKAEQAVADLRNDIQAYRGALGYTVPSSYAERLSDGTLPKNGIADALNSLNSDLRKRIEELEDKPEVCDHTFIRINDTETCMYCGKVPDMEPKLEVCVCAEEWHKLFHETHPGWNFCPYCGCGLKLKGG